MNFPFYIAKRYLFSKKSHNAINVISAISVCGVALATLALVCTLSVFNGFQDLVATFFTAFDPELKITAVTGKVFDGQEARIEALRRMPEIAVFSESLEENAMVQYKGRQTMAVIKGIEDNFEDLTAIDSILFGRGQFVLHDEVVDYAIPGIELVSILGTGIKFLDPLEIYAPKRGAKVNMANPASSFNSADLYSSGLVFAVNQQKYDSSYILTSLQFARTAARRKGIKAGLCRPKTLWPFPKKELCEATKHASHILDVEMSMGQMIDDVRLATECRLPVSFFGRTGGVIPTPAEVLAEIEKLAGGAE